MYLVKFGHLKSLELIIDHLEIGNLDETLIWGPPNDAMININNVLFH
jgi:hypothetical protein